MKIYIDSQYYCHATNPDDVFREVENLFFDNKCATFIEGYRYVPSGESYIGVDGIEYHGITPWKDYAELAAVQNKYEKQLLKEQATIIAELDAALLDAQYNILVGGL